MFDLGWSELLLIGVVALIVVGPKDLPGMFRTVGQFVGKAKLMARDFTQAMNDAADDAGVSDIQRSIERATKPVSSAMDEFSKSTKKSFTQQTMESGKPKESLDPVKVADTPVKPDAKADAKTDAKPAKAATAKSGAAKASTKATSTKSASAKAATTKKPAASKPKTTKASPAKAKAAKATSSGEDGTSKT